MKDLTPKEIVSFLDKYIIGQEKAKKAVSIALRNRARRKKVSDDLKKEISPKNIIMIGNTGIGKTEIARRMADLSDAPFIKIEATKFTEIGYVGRDVESIVRDLLNVAISNEKKKVVEKVQRKTDKLVEDKILNCLIPWKSNSSNNSKEDQERAKDFQKTIEKFRLKLKNGELEEKEIEIEIKKSPNNVFNKMMGFNNSQMDDMNGMIKNLFESFPKRKVNQKVKVKEARKLLREEVQENLINQDEIIAEAINKTENFGIVFLDEIDKIVSKNEYKGPEVSREGVQRDILPLVEGCSVNTRNGVIKTDHILFIAAGAFSYLLAFRHHTGASRKIPHTSGVGIFNSKRFRKHFN